MLETYRAAIKKMGIDAKLVNDICVGNVLTPGNGYMGMCCVMLYHHELMQCTARAGALAAGFPETTGVQTINRFCMCFSTALVLSDKFSRLFRSHVNDSYRKPNQMRSDRHRSSYWCREHVLRQR